MPVHFLVNSPSSCIVIDAAVLTSNVPDQAAIAMDFLREEIALRRAQIDAEKTAAASQKATNDALREERTGSTTSTKTTCARSSQSWMRSRRKTRHRF
jgi:hypothetical protein